MVDQRGSRIDIRLALSSGRVLAAVSILFVSWHPSLEEQGDRLTGYPQSLSFSLAWAVREVAGTRYIRVLNVEIGGAPRTTGTAHPIASQNPTNPATKKNEDSFFAFDTLTVADKSLISNLRNLSWIRNS